MPVHTLISYFYWRDGCLYAVDVDGNAHAVNITGDAFIYAC